MSRSRRCSTGAAIAVMLVGAPTVRAQSPPASEYGGFVDVAVLDSTADPANHLFRNRGTTPRVDELDINMAALFARRGASTSSRWGFELTAQTGDDSKTFGFSATAPNLGGADWLRHLGPTSVTYLAPLGRGLTIQGGIFNSLIGYDSLYAKDNFLYTRPWGADYTPYLMLGAAASYPVTDAVTVTGVMVNGYFHLAHANDAPSVGGQLAVRPNVRVTVKQTVLYGPHQEDVSLSHWRLLSDTILETRTARAVVVFEYQFGSELVATETVADRRAVWMAAQTPIHLPIAGPLTATLRPEFCWDRNGRWIGGPQSIVAVTAGGEYRRPVRGVETIVRGEYRLDSGDGDAAGFFAGADNHIVSTQHLWVLSVLLTWTRSISRS